MSQPAAVKAAENTVRDYQRRTWRSGGRTLGRHRIAAGSTPLFWLEAEQIESLILLQRAVKWPILIC
ncbi:hypothetical protein ACN47E_002344 [Coniothyrium glycines]